MIDLIFAMAFDPVWRRDTAIAVLVLLVLSAVLVRSTNSVGQGERRRRARLAFLAFLAGPLLAASIAGLSHAFTRIHPLDVGHHYSSIIAIGIIAGCILGLFFALTSLLCSNSPESSPRNPNP
jgi:hypothetical protein